MNLSRSQEDVILLVALTGSRVLYRASTDPTMNAMARRNLVVFKPAQIPELGQRDRWYVTDQAAGTVERELDPVTVRKACDDWCWQKSGDPIGLMAPQHAAYQAFGAGAQWGFDTALNASPRPAGESERRT